MKKPIKVIDIFSGPGGLGEGFSNYKNDDNKNAFKIAISIEMEKSAHRTLTLRAFYRQFLGKPPKEYYEFLQGNLGETPEEQLYKLPKFRKQVEAAQDEAQQLELGKDNKVIDERIANAIGKDECILIGGPPCQAYSMAGRSRNAGNKEYKAEKDHRNFLYKEYLKIIANNQPMLFVMENVKGMLSAKINGEYIYESIFADLKEPNKTLKIIPTTNRHSHKYKIFSFVTPINNEEHITPKDFIIKSEYYGVPQNRHRVILLGIREDLAANWHNDYILKPQAPISVNTVLQDLPPLRSGLSKDNNTNENWLKQIIDNASNTIKALKRISQDDIANEFQKTVRNLTVPDNGQGKNFAQKRIGTIKNIELKKWFKDKNLDNHICNHQTRGHLTADLQRYLFCSTWSKVGIRNNWSSTTPKSKDYPEELAPNHKNFSTGKFADRFRVQSENKPATTITSHISKDGHYFIHPDPLQCRSLTVREAARIQTFPDNYFFVGNRTQQYVQVGNAVPPLLAFKLASVVDKIIS